MQHLIAYRGSNVSLGVMQEMYLEKFLPWANDIEATGGTRMIPPVGLPEEIEWVRKLPSLRQQNVIFAVLVHRKGEGLDAYEYIGHTGIHRMSWPDRVATTGSILINKLEWEKGYGTEAKLLLMYHAFRVLGLRKLLSDVKAFNARSLGHLLKCGYKIVGRRTRQLFHDGQFVDEILLEVFREEWEPIWEFFKENQTLPSLSKQQRELVNRETTGTSNR